MDWSARRRSLIDDVFVALGFEGERTGIVDNAATYRMKIDDERCVAVTFERLLQPVHYASKDLGIKRVVHEYDDVFLREVIVTGVSGYNLQFDFFA